MSDILYGKRARLTVANESGDGMQVSDLQIEFNITKTSTQEANTASITVYNLAENTRNRYFNQDNRFILEFGYAGVPAEDTNFAGPLQPGESAIDYFTIFSGKATTIRKSERDGANIKTKIECGEGYDLNSFQPTITFDFAKDIEIQVNAFIENIKNLGFDVARDIKNQITEMVQSNKGDNKNGLSFSGPLNRQLNRLLSKFNKTFSIQNNVFQIYDKNGKVQNDARLITPESGLVRTPTWTELSTKKGQDGKVKKIPGIVFECKILPDVEPNKVVELELFNTDEFDGLWIPQRCVYTGDTYGTENRIRVEAIADTTERV